MTNCLRAVFHEVFQMSKPNKTKPVTTTATAHPTAWFVELQICRDRGDEAGAKRCLSKLRSMGFSVEVDDHDPAEAVRHD